MINPDAAAHNPTPPHQPMLPFPGVAPAFVCQSRARRPTPLPLRSRQSAVRPREPLFRVSPIESPRPLSAASAAGPSRSHDRGHETFWRRDRRALSRRLARHHGPWRPRLPGRGSPTSSWPPPVRGNFSVMRIGANWTVDHQPKTDKARPLRGTRQKDHRRSSAGICRSSSSSRPPRPSSARMRSSRLRAPDRDPTASTAGAPPETHRPLGRVPAARSNSTRRARPGTPCHVRAAAGIEDRQPRHGAHACRPRSPTPWRSPSAWRAKRDLVTHDRLPAPLPRRPACWPSPAIVFVGGLVYGTMYLIRWNRKEHVMDKPPSPRPAARASS